MAEILIRGAGAAIRRIREEKGLTLEQVADRFPSHKPCDKGHLSKYERNLVGLSSEVLDLLAHALGELPEVIALSCMKEVNPDLASTGIGSVLVKLVKALDKAPSMK